MYIRILETDDWIVEYDAAVGWYYASIWVVEDTVCHQVIAWMKPPKPYRKGGAE